jgi:hypothetical protein
VNKLTTVVHRIATTAGLLHSPSEGSAMPEYAVCDERAWHSKSNKAIVFWGGTMCSHIGVDSKCVQYQVDKFLDRPSGMEADQALNLGNDGAVGAEFTVEGFVQKFTVWDEKARDLERVRSHADRLEPLTSSYLDETNPKHASILRALHETLTLMSSHRLYFWAATILKDKIEKGYHQSDEIYTYSSKGPYGRAPSYTAKGVPD